MGHTIQHYDYPGNADTKKVEQELANYVAKRCFQEGVISAKSVGLILNHVPMKMKHA